MLRPKGIVTAEKGFRLFFITLLSIAAAILWIARPVAVMAGELVLDLKDGKKVKIVYDSTMENVVASVNGVEELKVSKKQPFPIELGPHTRKIAGIYPGPVIVFEGSWCALIGGKWIAYPAGSPCP